ncbi:hypothetical protein CF121_02635 [Aeromonas media]|nr:hypothetical protein CF121_02635 [Aeromonas media]
MGQLPFIAVLIHQALKAISSPADSALIFTYFQPLAIIENLFMNPTFWISFNVLIFKVIFILFRGGIGKGFHGETVIFIR